MKVLYSDIACAFVIDLKANIVAEIRAFHASIPDIRVFHAI